MDPNACVSEMVGLANILAKALDNDPIVSMDDIRDLCQMVVNLDDWLCKGGLVPDRWTDPT